ncbi:MAG: PH domain-containing protein [Firmicutes bacterium]|nr:PH domain-containing protein [Bacillota bacterium]MCM1400542.1 PH domain-containing protein [Bacteroides sp.]MCM1476446.1 PH domain-containing protein [Bacteroides sp.]
MTNHQINLEEITPVEALAFEPLDKKYCQAHCVGVALLYIILMGAAALILLTDFDWLFYIAEAALILTAIINLSLLPKAYHFKGYALREHDISYRTGIIFPKITTVPFSRVQQISTTQSPVSRLFKLYSVDVVNGAQTVSDLSIPGLTRDTAEKLKNLVTEKIRNAND